MPQEINDIFYWLNISFHIFSSKQYRFYLIYILSQTTSFKTHYSYYLHSFHPIKVYFQIQIFLNWHFNKEPQWQDTNQTIIFEYHNLLFATVIFICRRSMDKAILLAFIGYTFFLRLILYLRLRTLIYIYFCNYKLYGKLIFVIGLKLDIFLFWD